MEKWKWIKGFEGSYQVSSFGRVLSLARTTIDSKGGRHVIKEMFLKSQLDNLGYAYIRIYKNGKQYASLLHRLVGAAFIPNPDNKPEINHKNGVKIDNRVVNLEWVTHSENIKHAFRTGLRKILKGEEHNRSKLTEKEVARIKILNKTGKYTMVSLGKKFSTCPTNISSILHGHTWKGVGDEI